MQQTDDPDYIYQMQRQQAYCPVKPEPIEPVEIRNKSSGRKRFCLLNFFMWIIIIGTIATFVGSIQSKRLKLVALIHNLKKAFELSSHFKRQQMPFCDWKQG